MMPTLIPHVGQVYKDILDSSGLGFSVYPAARQPA
jgi:hypothetical protein